MKKLPLAVLLVLLASFVLVACGGSSSSSSETTSEPTTEESGGAAAGEENEESEGGEEAGGSGGTLAIEAASSGLAFASKTATSEAGSVTVDFTNPQSVPHDVAIEDSSKEVLGETEVVAEGESSTTVELEPGTYKFFCTIPGHREAGMEGTLTVK